MIKASSLRDEKPIKILSQKEQALREKEKKELETFLEA